MSVYSASFGILIAHKACLLMNTEQAASQLVIITKGFSSLSNFLSLTNFRHITSRAEKLH